MTEAQQSALLASEIAKYTRKGYVVEGLNATTATLAKKIAGTGIGGNVFLTVITCGLWLLLWIPALIAQGAVGASNTHRLVISVDELGLTLNGIRVQHKA